MYPVSELFKNALRTAHQMTARVELWQADTMLTKSLAFSGGSVTFDRTNQVYGTCQIDAQVIADRGLLVGAPDVDVSDLNVYGLVLRPYRGIQYPDGSVEEVPLGRYLVEQTRRAVNDTEVTLSGSGFRSFIRDDKFLTPYHPTAGTLQRDVLKTLILDSRPGDTVNAEEFAKLPADVVPRGVLWEQDRLAAIDELATGLGVLVYPDRNGVWRFDPAGDPATTAPSWTVDAGPNGVLLTASLSNDRASVYNAVITRRESDSGATKPRQGVALHTDPASPTRWGGPFGRRPRFYSSALLTTQAKLDEAAKTLLRKALLADTVIDCTAVPNPALDPDDAIRVVLPDSTELVYMVDGVTVPLVPADSLTIATRQRPAEEEP